MRVHNNTINQSQCALVLWLLISSNKFDNGFEDLKSTSERQRTCSNDPMVIVDSAKIWKASSRATYMFLQDCKNASYFETSTFEVSKILKYLWKELKLNSRFSNERHSRGSGDGLLNYVQIRPCNDGDRHVHVIQGTHEHPWSKLLAEGRK